VAGGETAARRPTEGDVRLSIADFADILVCPPCRAALTFDAHSARCSACGRRYVAENDIWRFIAEEVVAQDEVKSINAAYHDREAPFYDDMHLHVRAEVALLQSALRDLELENKVVLDVATGTGFLARQMPPSCQLICLDISVGMLERVKATRPQGMMLLLQGDAEQLPLQNASVDVVTISSALHHLPSPPRALNEMQRVLKPGGYLLVFHEPQRVRHSLLFRALRLAGRTFHLLPNGNGKRAEQIKSLASQVFEETDGNRALALMEQANAAANVHAGFQPAQLLPDGLRLRAVETYFAHRSPWHRLMEWMCPMEGDLFYLIAERTAH
jgi:ubiquinone/menaquinone biosynthesis C-methylase UbiE